MTKDRSHIKSISQIPFLKRTFLCTKTSKITYVRLRRDAVLDKLKPKTPKREIRDQTHGGGSESDDHGYSIQDGHQHPPQNGRG